MLLLQIAWSCSRPGLGNAVDSRLGTAVRGCGDCNACSSPLASGTMRSPRMQQSAGARYNAIVAHVITFHQGVGPPSRWRRSRLKSTASQCIFSNKQLLSMPTISACTFSVSSQAAAFAKEPRVSCLAQMNVHPSRKNTLETTMLTTVSAVSAITTGHGNKENFTGVELESTYRKNAPIFALAE